MGEFGSDNSVVEMLEPYFHLLVVVCLAHIGDLEACQPEFIMERQAPLVEQQFDVTGRVDMSVDIYVAIGEPVRVGGISCYRSRSRWLVDRADLVGRNQVCYPFHV